MNEEITFKELREAKTECEIAIWQALTKLNAHTGLRIEGVKLRDATFDGSFRVQVDVSIP